MLEEGAHRLQDGEMEKEEKGNGEEERSTEESDESITTADEIARGTIARETMIKAKVE